RAHRRATMRASSSAHTTRTSASRFAFGYHLPPMRREAMVAIGALASTGCFAGGLTKRPTVTCEVGAGVLGSPSGGASPGPAMTSRVGLIVAPRWTVEAEYEGALNRRKDVGGSLVSTAIDAGARYDLLRPSDAPLVPYLAAGVGYASFTGS